MADFISDLVRQVLGAAPQVVPLLPPRYAPWPGIPRSDAEPKLQEQTDALERADLVLLPSSLIVPANPAVLTPLPTFRQMRELRSTSGPPIHPGQTLVDEDTPEKTDFEQGEVHQVILVPVRSAADETLSSALQAASPPDPMSQETADEPPAIHALADNHTDRVGIASPAPSGVSNEQPPKKMTTSERDLAVPPPPARLGRLLHLGQAEPVETRPEQVKSQTESIEQPTEPVEGYVEPVKGQAEFVETQAEQVESHRANKLVQPLDHIPASAPLPVQPATSVATPVVQRRVVPGSPMVAPLATPQALTIKPDLTVSTQDRQTHAPHSLITASQQPVPPTGHAVPAASEPTIVPAPEPTPVEIWPSTENVYTAFLRPPLEQVNASESEPAPTVRVTIGRVVVRASPAAERPPSQSVELPRPPLSLEEYLKSRQEGER